MAIDPSLLAPTFQTFPQGTYRSEPWKLVDGFDSSYWTGLEMDLYLGDILMDELIQFNYQVVEQTRMGFHYSSYVANRIYHGVRMISGEFTLNFKNAGFIHALVNILRGGRPRISEFQGEDQPEMGGYATGDPAWLVQDFNIEEFVDNPDIAPMAVYQFVNDRVKALEASKMTYAVGKEVNVPRFAGMFEIAPYGFDMTVVFGGRVDNNRLLRWNDRIGAGPGPMVYQDDALAVGITGVRFVGVSIVGVARSAADDGRPLVETISFQARDMAPVYTRNLYSTIHEAPGAEPSAPVNTAPSPPTPTTNG